jgi:hypothetical protein
MIMFIAIIAINTGARPIMYKEIRAS